MTESLTAANRDLNNEAIIYQVLYGCLAIVHATLMTVIKIKMLINSHRNGSFVSMIVAQMYRYLKGSSLESMGQKMV